MIAIEIELTLKTKARLERILRGYLRNRNVATVRYYAPPQIANAVAAGGPRDGADALLELAPLPASRDTDDLETAMSDSSCHSITGC